ncbi:hypothetical protein GCM10025771_33440 [Niveibacterium umoris]|uniref:AMMECR1 domain-containing protein n=1 Tax=Niveibacterium umoris TaxID=1193620 RepID=A0A840BFL2_9RHOO|nr:AmmeMemoRadiSam system protein A [Niveibacterium umoris]MBB4011463.1 hypothetical protein [Niveibacterium umoris]
MPTDTALGPLLIAHARHAIAQGLGLDSEVPPDAPALHEQGAVFVTLTQDDRLRGCIGSLVAYRPLGEDVRANAFAAAFRDPRFAPLTAHEWAGTDLEVSLIGPTEWRVCASEAEAIAWLRPGVDGVILEHAGLRATFLPQVWSSLPTSALFLYELRRKAGMRGDRWPADMRVGRYQVEKYHGA